MTERQEAEIRMTGIGTSLEPVGIRELQKAGLIILDSFLDICGKHGLRYYLNAGTLLGAVRHQGYIPWDDDIDVCMPRPDYERFLKYAKQELPDGLRAVWFGDQGREEHPQYTCQIQDTRFPIVQMIARHERETCAWIDVFPMDGMPSNPVRRKIHEIYLLYLRARIQASMFDLNVNIHKKGRPLHERLAIRVIARLKWGSSGDTYALMKKLDTALKKYPADQSGFWINFMGAYKTKETIPVTAYGQGAKLPFEGRECAVPASPEIVLTRLYGDYMTPVKPDSSDDGHRLYRRKTDKVVS